MFPTMRTPPSTAQRMRSRGHSPRTICAAHRGCPSSQAGRAWKISPYDVWGRFRRATDVIRRPTTGRRGRRPLRAVCIFRVAACNVGAQPAHHFLRAHLRYPLTDAGRAWKPAPTGYPPLTDVGFNPSVTALCAATAPLSGEPGEVGALRRRCTSTGGGVRCNYVVRRPAAQSSSMSRASEA